MRQMMSPKIDCWPSTLGGVGDGELSIEDGPTPLGPGEGYVMNSAGSDDDSNGDDDGDGDGAELLCLESESAVNVTPRMLAMTPLTFQYEK